MKYFTELGHHSLSAPWTRLWKPANMMLSSLKWMSLCGSETDKMHSWAKGIVSNSITTNELHPLSACRNAASSVLLYGHFLSRCSTKFTMIMLTFFTQLNIRYFYILRKCLVGTLITPQSIFLTEIQVLHIIHRWFHMIMVKHCTCLNI